MVALKKIGILILVGLMAAVVYTVFGVCAAQWWGSGFWPQVVTAAVGFGMVVVVWETMQRLLAD